MKWHMSKDAAGQLTFWRGDCFALHLLVRQQYRQWGLSADWYDGPLYSFGLGPILLVVWRGRR